MGAGKAQFAAKDYEKSLVEFQRAATQAEAFPAHDPRLPETLNNLGMALFALERLDEAERILLKAWRSCEDANGQRSLPTFVSLCNLADCYRAQKKYGSAEDLYRRANVLTPGIKPQNPVALARFASTLGFVCERQGKFAEALEFYTTAQKTLGMAFPDDNHADIPTAFINQGRMRELLKSDARTSFSFADLTLSKLYGNDDPRRVQALRHIAQSQAFGDSQEKQDAALEALRILELKFGKNDPRTLPAFAILATVSSMNRNKGNQNFNKEHTLESSLDRAIELYKNAPAEINALYAQALVDLAALFQDTNKDKAAEFLTRASEWAARNRGSDSEAIQFQANTLSGKSAKAVNQTTEPVPVQPKSETAGVVTPAPAAPATAASPAEIDRQWKMARYRAIGHAVFRDADNVWELALGIIGNQEPDQRHLEGLERLAQKKRSAEAAERFRATAEKVLGANHPDTLRATRMLAEFQIKGPNGNAAEELARKVLADAEKLPGANLLSLAPFRFTLAMALTRNKKYTEADKLFSSTMTDVQSAPGYAGLYPKEILGAWEDALKALDKPGAPKNLSNTYSKWAKSETDALVWQSEFLKAKSAFDVRLDFGLNLIREAAVKSEVFPAGDERIQETNYFGIKSAIAAGDYAQAEKFLSKYKDGLKSQSPDRPKDKQKLSQLLIWQSEISLSKGDSEAVEMELTSALAGLDASGGGGSNEAVEVLTRLLHLARFQKKDALPTAQRLLTLIEKLPAGNTAPPHSAWAEVFEQFLLHGKLSDAEAVFDRLSKFENIQGTAAQLERQARLSKAKGMAALKGGDFSTAMKEFQSMLNSDGRGLGSLRGETLLFIAKCHRGLKQPTECEKALKEALEQEQSLWGPSDPRTLAVYDESLSFYKEQKKVPEATRIEQILKYIKAIKPAG